MLWDLYDPNYSGSFHSDTFVVELEFGGGLTEGAVVGGGVN